MVPQGPAPRTTAVFSLSTRTAAGTPPSRAKQPVWQLCHDSASRRPRPHDRLAPAPGQHHVQRHQVDHLVAQQQPREVRPVHLRLRPGRRLDPPPRPHRRRRIGPPPVALHRPQAPLVPVLAPQPGVQRRQVHPTLLLLRPPMLDRLRLALRPQVLQAAPVRHARRHAPEVMPHRPLRHTQEPRHRALRMTPFQQHRHRRPSLDIETTHRPPPAVTAGKSIRPRRPLVNLDVALNA